MLSVGPRLHTAPGWSSLGQLSPKPMFMGVQTSTGPGLTPTTVPISSETSHVRPSSQVRGCPPAHTPTHLRAASAPDARSDQLLEPRGIQMWQRIIREPEIAGEQGHLPPHASLGPLAGPHSMTGWQESWVVMMKISRSPE